MTHQQRDDRVDEAIERVKAGETVTAVADDLELTREHLSRRIAERRATARKTTRFVLGFAVTA